MTVKEAAEFEIEFVQVLDEHGNADKKLMPKLSKKQVEELHYWMVLERAYDDKALKLQRQGRVATRASSYGEEGTHVGAVYACGKNDWIFPSYREHASFLMRGVPVWRMFQGDSGDERAQQIDPKGGVFTYCIPIATQLPHAVGFAWGGRLKGADRAVLAWFGDGGTSEGDFHEAMNFAGVFKAPVVFCCRNNQFAISVPRERQTAARTLAQKALAYGFGGVQVDGNDVFGVYRVVKEAMDNARKGNGPRMVECVTYRLADHTTADDASRYRSAEEVEKWRKRDPIQRLEKYMKAEKVLSEREVKAVYDGVEKEVNEAVKKFEALDAPGPEDILSYLYTGLPEFYEQQLEALKRAGKT